MQWKKGLDLAVADSPGRVFPDGAGVAIGHEAIGVVVDLFVCMVARGGFVVVDFGDDEDHGGGHGEGQAADGEEGKAKATHPVQQGPQGRTCGQSNGKRHGSSGMMSKDGQK